MIMAEEFKPIETQEDLNFIIGKRLKQQKDQFAEELAKADEYKNQLEEVNKQKVALEEALKEANEKISGFDAQLSERDTKIKAYELDSVKTKVAGELGLSYKAKEFLQGEDEESIRQSAETLKGLVGTHTAPLASSETIPASDSTEAAYKSLLHSLKFNE